MRACVVIAESSCQGEGFSCLEFSQFSDVVMFSYLTCFDHMFSINFFQVSR